MDHDPSTPRSAHAWAELGARHLHAQDYTAAAAAWREAITVYPDNAAWHAALSHALAALGQFDLSVQHLAHAIRLNPREADYFCELAHVLITLEQLADASECAEVALSLNPAATRALNALGLIALLQGRWAHAVSVFSQARELEPHNTATLNNLGLAYREQRQIPAALACFTAATTLAPEFSDAWFNQALTLLLVGDTTHGWPLYLHHKRLQQLNRPHLGPCWDGQVALNGKRILVVREQGLGDTIQFVRFIAALVKRGATVLLAPQPALWRLLTRFNTPCELVRLEDDKLTADYHIPLASLAALLPLADAVPVPYLFAEEKRQQHWQGVIGQTGFKIGIHWQGSRGRVDLGRSIPLTAFYPLAAIASVRLISLQKGHGCEQLAQVPAHVCIETLPEPWDEATNAFVDTAAIITSLDLIITSDTALAHLAGALGAEVWLLLKQVPDWRWQLDRADSPWYPSMRLFRQSADGDWDAVFRSVAASLRARLAT